MQVTKVQRNIFKEGKGLKEVVEEGARRNGGVFAAPNALDGLRAFVEVSAHLDSCNYTACKLIIPLDQKREPRWIDPIKPKL